MNLKVIFLQFDIKKRFLISVLITIDSKCTKIQISNQYLSKIFNSNTNLKISMNCIWDNNISDLLI